MSGDEVPRAADVKALNLSISASLRSCRSMIANYRAMISAEANDNFPDQPFPNDEASGHRPSENPS